MELFLLRHGHAEAEAPKDRLRELSARGRIEVQSSIRQHRESVQQVQRIVVSPYLRAQQTAQVVLDELGAHGGGIIKVDSKLFVPSGSVSLAINFLHDTFAEGVTSLMVVGHQPLLGILLDELCGAEPGKYRMGTASLAALDLEVLAAGLCDLRWLYHAQC